MRSPDPRRENPLGAELVLAADQFIITPAGRAEEAARARAAGEEVRTVIAGYHWFTDWGRDTMISLEGLTLTTRPLPRGGLHPATFAHYIRDGLIPNMFPDGAREGLYHTADATLWFFHAVHRYVDSHRRRRHAAPAAAEARRHRRASSAGHAVRHRRRSRGRAAAPGRRGLSAHVDGREGRRLGRDAAARQGGRDQRALVQRAAPARRLGQDARRRAGGSRPRASTPTARVESFNRRFWYDEGGYLYDVVDGEAGDDPACRPNQVFAISLDHPVLDRARWEPVMQVVRERLLTPVGLRSLAPGHPDYKAKYYGDLRSRDAAYHQGTVWGWLIGPFVDAWLKVHPEDRAGRAALLEGSRSHLGGSVRRVDQRDLRRRGAVYAARLRRAGLERRRSAAVPREDRRARTPRSRARSAAVTAAQQTRTTVALRPARMRTVPLIPATN